LHSISYALDKEDTKPGEADKREMQILGAKLSEFAEKPAYELIDHGRMCGVAPDPGWLKDVLESWEIKGRAKYKELYDAKKSQGAQCVTPPKTISEAGTRLAIAIADMKAVAQTTDQWYRKVDNLKDELSTAITGARDWGKCLDHLQNCLHQEFDFHQAILRETKEKIDKDAANADPHLVAEYEEGKAAQTPEYTVPEANLIKMEGDKRKASIDTMMQAMTSDHLIVTEMADERASKMPKTAAEDDTMSVGKTDASASAATTK